MKKDARRLFTVTPVRSDPLVQCVRRQVVASVHIGPDQHHEAAHFAIRPVQQASCWMIRAPWVKVHRVLPG